MELMIRSSYIPRVYQLHLTHSCRISVSSFPVFLRAFSRSIVSCGFMQELSEQVEGCSVTNLLFLFFSLCPLLLETFLQSAWEEKSHCTSALDQHGGPTSLTVPSSPLL